MGTRKKAGADAPAVEINGHEIFFDKDMASTWDAFRCLRILNDEEADAMDRTDAALRYAQLVSGLDEDAIVEIAGGGKTQVADVMNVVAQIIAAASPKN